MCVCVLVGNVHMLHAHNLHSHPVSRPISCMSVCSPTFIYVHNDIVFGEGGGGGTQAYPWPSNGVNSIG